MHSITYRNGVSSSLKIANNAYTPNKYDRINDVMYRFMNIFIIASLSYSLKQLKLIIGDADEIIKSHLHHPIVFRRPFHLVHTRIPR